MIIYFVFSDFWAQKNRNFAVINDKDSDMNILVYGPQGCGKTRNADKICAYFNATGSIDSEDLDIAKHVDNFIIFTNDHAKPYDFNYDQLLKVIPGLV